MAKHSGIASDMQDISVKELSCPICLEILSNPSKVQCGHTFCRSCVLSLVPATCPICRETFDPLHINTDNVLANKIQTSIIDCPYCQQRMLASELRIHNKHCQPVNVKINRSKHAGKAPRNVPNRSTFSCPYCHHDNLTVDDLVKHCNKLHKHDRKDMVCPVCAAMPWGDSEQRSHHFIEHLNCRHKFEYDTYVDYSQDDDEMLQAVIEASLEQQ